MAQLEVQIGANIDDLLKKLNLTEKEFKELAVTAAKSGKTIDQALKDAGKGGKAIQQSAEVASQGINKMQGATANAIPSITSFSQVVQDAPYGIRGVANNIQQLTMQFGILQKSTGGTVGALKAMVGTLAGPAGILLAVSAVTSLLVTYGDKLSFAADKTSELAKATKDYLGDAIAEKTALESLLSIARDETNSKVQRSAAIAEINEKYSKYLGFLDEDSIKTDQVTTSVKLLTLALLQKAKIQGLADVIAEKSKDASEDLISLDLKRQNSLATVKEELKRLNKENAFFNKVIDETDLGTLEGVNRQLKNVQNSSQSASDGTLSFLFESVKQFKNLSKEIKGVNSDLDDTLLPLVQLQETLKKQVFEVDAKVNIDSNADSVVDLGTIKTDVKDTGGKARIAQAQKNAETLLFIEQDLANEITGITEGQWESINNIYKSSGAELTDYLAKLKEDEAFQLELDTDKFRVDFAVSQIEILENRAKQLGNQLSRLGLDPNQFNLDAINLEQLDLLEQKLRVVGEVTNVLGNAISSSIGSMVEKLGGYLATGNEFIDSFVGSILQSLAQLLTQLITQQIAQAAAQTAVASATVASQAATAGALAATSGVVAQSQGVQVATSFAAALGPAGFVLLPGLLASTFATIQAALLAGKAIGSFAEGGYTTAEGKRDNTGFRVAGIVHEGEYVVPKKVLQTKAGAQMVNQLEGLRKFNRTPNNFSGLTTGFASGGFTSIKNVSGMIYNTMAINNLSNLSNSPISNNISDGIVGEVVLRGNNQVIQLRRSEKKMNRFYNS